MIKKILLISILLFPLTSFADTSVSSGNDSASQSSAPIVSGDASLATITDNESVQSATAAIRNMAKKLILPSLPGATLLLVICVLISTLTFYADLKRSNLSGRGSHRYLALWIFGNYSFALVLLVLILPEGTRLDQLDRTLLLYCILASGLPEMSAYMRIQLGNSNKGVNLYKIREMFTNYIARQVNSISENNEWQELQLFKYAFIGKQAMLDEKLIAFTNMCDFSDAEKHQILACLPSANQNDLDASVGQLMALNSIIKSKLFSFFREDIRRYQLSSSAKLVKSLYPPISAMEAQSLVTNGIISPLRFLMRTIGKSRRNNLSNITHIENTKLALLHNELKMVYRLKIKRFIMGTFVFFVFVVLSSLILSNQAVNTTEQEASFSAQNAISIELPLE